MRDWEFGSAKRSSACWKAPASSGYPSTGQCTPTACAGMRVATPSRLPELGSMHLLQLKVSYTQRSA
eukprot:5744763-Amphidinium_carterae.1